MHFGHSFVNDSKNEILGCIIPYFNVLNPLSQDYYLNIVFLQEKRITLSKKSNINIAVWNCHTLLSLSTLKNMVLVFVRNWFVEQVIVEFYSDTCPACKRLEPHWNRLSCDAKKLFPDVKFARVCLSLNVEYFTI